MIATQNISLSYSGKPLFKNVNIKFTAGNCYGIIGANGTGKSTFLKVLSGELEPTTGEVVITPGERMAVLRQNHFEFDLSLIHISLIFNPPQTKNGSVSSLSLKPRMNFASTRELN